MRECGSGPKGGVQLWRGEGEWRKWGAVMMPTIRYAWNTHTHNDWCKVTEGSEWLWCVSGCFSESSIKKSALSARASEGRGAVWELGEAYSRPRAWHSVTKLRSKVVSRESARSANRKVLLVLLIKQRVLGEAAGPKHYRRGLGRTRKWCAALINLYSVERRGNSGPKSLCFANYYRPVIIVARLVC